MKLEELQKLALKLGADQATVTRTVSTEQSISLANNKIEEAETAQEQEIQIALIKNGKYAIAYGTDPTNMQSAIKAALKNSKYNDLVDYALPEPITPIAMPRANQAILEYTIEQAIEDAEALLDTKEKVISGGISTNDAVIDMLTPEGYHFQTQEAYQSAYVGLIKNHTNHVANGYGHDLYLHNTLEADKILHQAEEKLAQYNTLENNAKLGEQPTIWHPEALTRMLNLVLNATQGPAMEQNQSPWKQDDIGNTILSTQLTVEENPHDLNAPYYNPYTVNLQPTRRQKLIHEGELKFVPYGHLDAHKYHQTATPHNYGNGLSTKPGTAYSHLAITTKETPQNLLQEQDGMLIESLLGAHTANPITGDFSITIPSPLRVVNGEITNTTKPINLAGNIYDLLKQETLQMDNQTEYCGKYHLGNTLLHAKLAQ